MQQSLSLTKTRYLESIADRSRRETNFERVLGDAATMKYVYMCMRSRSEA